MLKTLYTHRIPEIVEEFKKVMGIAIAPSDQNHFLYPLFLEYERNTTLLAVRNMPIPDEVIELATYAYSVLLFRRCWQGKNFEMLRWRLNDPHEVKGVLFEFRAAVHYVQKHRNVNWLPPLPNKVDYDLFVETNSNKAVNVECTRRYPNSERINSHEALEKDIVASFRLKSEEIKETQVPVIIDVLLPEIVDFQDSDRKSYLDNRIPNLFDDIPFSNATILNAISYRKPSSKILNNQITVWDTDFSVISYANRHLFNKLPADFYPIKEPEQLIQDK